jgi:5-methylcytosine-specific restriction endonuclease McrA
LQRGPLPLLRRSGSAKPIAEVRAQLTTEHASPVMQIPKTPGFTPPSQQRFRDAQVVASYRIDFETWGIEKCQLHLIGLDRSPTMHRYWPAGLTADIVDFLVSHCRCTYCGAEIAKPIGPCACGEAEGDGFVLVAAYDRVKHREDVKRLYDREESRAGHRSRRKLLAMAGGSIRPGELKELLAAQGCICYYCAASLLDEAGKPRYHADHYLALADQGRNDLDNMVLACPPCNLEKNSMSPARFERILRKRRSPEDAERLRKMRQLLRAWRRQRKASAAS